MFRKSLAVACLFFLHACGGGSTHTPTVGPPSPAPVPPPQTLSNTPPGAVFAGTSRQGLEFHQWNDPRGPLPVSTYPLDGSVSVETTANGIVLHIAGDAAAIDL